MPNDTRAAGVHLFIHSLVRSRWNLDLYWHLAPDAATAKLEEEDWQIAAELEAVLYPIKLLTKQLQSNRFGSNSYSFLYTMRTYRTYATQNQWYVADVCKLSDPNLDLNIRWHAGAQFPQRNYSGMPLSWKDGTKWDANQKREGLEKVWMVPKRRDQLHELTQKLIVRIEKEFRNYTAKPTKNQLMAMACNPLTATIGMQELSVQSELLKTKAVDPDSAQFCQEFVELCSVELLNEVNLVCDKMKYNSDAHMDEEDSTATADDETQLVQNLYKVMEQRQKKKKSRVENGTPIDTEVQNFFESDFNWKNILKLSDCPKEAVMKISDDSCSNIENWELIAQHFDIMKWWEEIGKVDYPHIYIIACIVLPLPDSNASQERTFSSATWMDGKLNKQQSDATFQMKIILKQNSKFLEETRIQVKEDYRREVANHTKQMLEDAMKLREFDMEKLEEKERTERKQPQPPEPTTADKSDAELDSDLICKGFQDMGLDDIVDDEEEAIEEYYEYESLILD
jgi:hAT family C-terminal dimerisation region